MKPVARKAEWTALSYGAGAAAAFVTHRVLAFAWQQMRDAPPPDPSDRDTPLSPALIWAIASGVGLAVSRLIAMRGAAAVWEAATNEPPP